MNQDRAARTGLPGQGCQDRAASTGVLGQDIQGRTERRRQPEKERHVRQIEQDNLNGTARMGQAEQDCKDRTNRTGLPEQDCQHRTASTGLPAQGCKNKTARARQKRDVSRKDSQNRTARQDRQIYLAGTGQSEQDIQDRANKQETEQDFQHSPFRTVLLGQDFYSRTNKTGQLGT